MRLRNYLLVCTLLVLSAAGPVVRAQTDPKATVVGITGRWKLRGALPACTPPKQGEDPHLVHFACSVGQNSDAEGTKGGSLVVLFDKDGDAYSYGCDRPTKEHSWCGPSPDQEFPCVCHIVPPKKPDTLSAKLSATWAVVSPLFQESPARYITPVSRGLEAELADGVVPLQGDRVDFAPAFQEMDKGTYRLRLESLSGSTKASIPVQLQWAGSGPAAISAPGMQPGLYRVVRLTPNGEPAGLDAWVLVSSPDRFAKDSAGFQSAVEQTKKWPHDVDARAPRAILRAYLDSLSRKLLKGQ